MRIQPLFNQADLIILESLAKDKKTTFSTMCKHPQGNPQTMKRAIDKLISKGIISRKVNPETKREKLLSYCYKNLELDEMIKLLKG